MIEEFLLFWVDFKEFKKSPNWDVRFNLKRTLLDTKTGQRNSSGKFHFIKLLLQLLRI